MACCQRWIKLIREVANWEKKQSHCCTDTQVPRQYAADLHVDKDKGKPISQADQNRVIWRNLACQWNSSLLLMAFCPESLGISKYVNDGFLYSYKHKKVITLD